MSKNDRRIAAWRASNRIALNENEGQGIESCWSPEEKAFFIQFISPKQNDQVLDIGCGNGVFSRWLTEKGCHVCGLDFSRRALRQAKPYQNGTIQGDIVNLPFQDAIFDCVVFIEVLEHVPPSLEQHVLSEIRRVLKPGGTLALHTSPNIIAEFFCLFLNPIIFVGRLLGLTKRPYFAQDHSHDDIHINKHNTWSLSRSVRMAGFDGSVRAYTSFCTFPWSWIKRISWLENQLFASLFGLRLRGLLRRPMEGACNPDYGNRKSFF